MVNSTAFLITFSVAIAVCIPIFLYIAKRNPNPHFRPRPGELLLLAIVMIGGSAGVSILFCTLFGVDDLMRGLDKGPPTTPRPAAPILDDDPDGGLFE